MKINYAPISRRTTTRGENRTSNIVNLCGKSKKLREAYIESDPNTTGVMIAVDGTEMPIVEGY